MKEKNILLIDDEEITRDELTQIFEKTKYKLYLAANSIEGLKYIEQYNFDLILMDIIMPDLSSERNERAGFELLKMLVEKKPHIPVIMISVQTHADIALEALDLGAVDYIAKDTMTSKSLIEKVEKALRAVGGLPEEPDLLSLIRKGEDSRLEFKSTMRWNLKENKPNKGVEFAWLKTIVAFMNTDGGTLLIGVEDDGNVLGISADNFQNEDKFLLHFDNLIRDYIGLEFSRLIKHEFVLIDGKKILKVDCERSKDEVFFKRSETDEDFYIRVGPSSRYLTSKKMLDYLKNRKD